MNAKKKTSCKNQDNVGEQSMSSSCNSTNLRSNNPRSFIQGLFIFILLSLAVSRFVLNVFTPIMEPSEARYAVFAKNMTQSGNWWQPTYNFEGVETVFI